MHSFGNWELAGQLGQGGFGEVLHWRHSGTNQEIATKHIKNVGSLSADQQIKLSERWNQEFQWTRELQQLPHIVAGVILDETDQAFLDYLNSRHIGKLPVIVLEYCNGGDVRKRLQSPENANGLVEFEVREILGAVRLALHFLHSKCNVCHRDLKPDNIVIQCGANGRKVYKLTDFGLARSAPDKTMLQSVVGTRHYFAPEVVATGVYNTAVDYWSLGVIGFELATGDLPFMPHQSLPNILVNVMNKPNDCIAIQEDRADSNRFEFQSQLPQQHHLSQPFAEGLTNWLRLALDKDYKRRGQMATDEVQQSVPAVFLSLDKLLQLKVLTIFAVNCRKCLEYAVTPEMTQTDLCKRIERDTGIARTEVYIVLPAAHPHKRITPETRPIDLYVNEWSDTSKESRRRYTPPVMLYVFHGGETGKAFSSPDPCISSLMLTCMSKKFESKQSWLSKRLALDFYYMISKEQADMEMLVSGVHEHALTLEDEVISSKFKDNLSMPLNVTSYAYNQLKNLRSVIQKENPTMQFNDDAKWDKLSSNFEVIIKIAEAETQHHFESGLREAPLMVVKTKQLLNDLVEKDLFDIARFQKKYLKPNGGGIALEDFRRMANEFAAKRSKLQKDGKVQLASQSIDKLHLRFTKTKNMVPRVLQKLNEIQKDIFDVHLNMLRSASNACIPPMVQLSDAMGELSLCSGGPNSLPFDSIAVSLIEKAERLNDM
ncbi:hypothetical protein KR009_002888 [Drosophila setifemur]|nr:hypothetical protein KR009_002888 [Drosophila setifemur]